MNDASTYLVFIPTELICQASLLAGIFQFYPAHSGSFYLVFLFGALVQTSMIFVEFLDGTFSPSAPSPPPD